MNEMHSKLTLTVLPEKLAIAQLTSGEKIPPGVLSHPGFWTISRTAEEVSIVGEEALLKDLPKIDKGWRCLKLEGTYDFALTGILASILDPLAKAKVGIFAISTFNTDYVLLKEINLVKAKAALAETFIIKDSSLGIIDYRPEFQPQFKALNVAWIVKDFYMEPIDEFQLDHPDESILKNGGCILLAKFQDQIVGTCALLKLDDQTVEMIKMAVDENYRGLKIGYSLGKAILDRGRAIGAKKMTLFSNTRGSANAVALYRKLGFKEIPLDSDEFKRANIKMEIEL